MTAEDLLQHLRQLGVSLEWDGQQLHFKAPRGVLTSVLRQQIAENKMELGHILESGQAGKPMPGSSNSGVERDRLKPLSQAQELLWFYHELEPDSPAYNVSLAFRVQGFF